MSKRILHIVTNVSRYKDVDQQTGLWLGELTHAYDEFEKQGYIQDIVSPNGGKTPIEPKSLVPLVADKSVKDREKDQAFITLLANTFKPSDINWQDYDVIYYTGGHGVMWDFLDNPELQEITKNIYEKGGIVSSVCHGYCGLLNVRLSNGEKDNLGRLIGDAYLHAPEAKNIFVTGDTVKVPTDDLGNFNVMSC
ncbi:type 1 glutamine amidotransferase domain-containing protein, partial [Acinetobacter baumannii]